MKNLLSKIFFILIIFFCFSLSSYAVSSEPKILTENNLKIEYESSNLTLANQISSMYKPALKIAKDELKLDFNREVYIKICKDKATFQKFTGINNLSVQGIAVSEYNLIVISAENIFYKGKDDIQHLLEHELAHLVLADYIGHQSDEHFPRWLNEGLAQFISDGSNELFSVAYQNSLQTAFITNHLIPFSSLMNSFPNNQSDFTQAYAQSLSIVEYLNQTYGNEKLTLLVKNLKSKDNFYQIFFKTYGINFNQVEQNWINVKKKSGYTFDYYLSTHINSIIDGFVGITALLVFIVVYFRNKNRKKRMIEEFETEEIL